MNKKSYYGAFGGQYVAESLMNTLKELDDAFEKYTKDEEFLKEVDYYLKQYVGRETPLYFASRLSEAYGTKIYLKREDLNHTGAHKINNVIGQIPEPVSMVWQLQPEQLFLIWNVPYIWERRI